MEDVFTYTPRDNFFYASKRQAWANCAAPKGSPRPLVTFINGTSGKPINTEDSRIETRMFSRGEMLLYQMVVKDATEHDTHPKWACKASSAAGDKYSYFKVEFYSKLIDVNSCVTNFDPSPFVHLIGTVSHL